MANIIDKILSHQNLNQGRIFVSATCGKTATYDPTKEIHEVVVRYTDYSKYTAIKVNRTLFDEGFFLTEADTTNNEYTFLKR